MDDKTEIDLNDASRVTLRVSPPPPRFLYGDGELSCSLPQDGRSRKALVGHTVSAFQGDHKIK